jgi:hypothetical protein
MFTLDFFPKLFKFSIVYLFSPHWLTLSSSHWVNVEWDSQPTETTWSETQYQLSQCTVYLILFLNNLKLPICSNFLSFCINSVDLKSHSALTQLMDSETTHVPSRHGTIKILNILVNSRIWTEPLTRLLISPCKFDTWKKYRIKMWWKFAFKLFPSSLIYASPSTDISLLLALL